VSRRELLALAVTLLSSAAFAQSPKAEFRTIGVLVIGKPDPAPMLENLS
jgi:hypothetical protein